MIEKITTMKNILQKLLAQQTLTMLEAEETLRRIAVGDFNDYQLAAFMAVFQLRSITLDELKGFRTALLALARPIDFGEIDSIDLCGTGGDGKDTFNISTLAAVVVAGAGYTVTKHGNYGVSSVCGSSNVLEAMGYQFTADEQILKQQLAKHKICFLHAPLFHPAMKAVAPVRKGLGIRTFFNLLGPLVNPLQPTKQLVGVSNLKTLRLYQYLLQETTRDFTIVHALDGYDEVSLTGDFRIVQRDKEQQWQPEQINQQRQDPIKLAGGTTVKAAAKIFETILEGEGSVAQNQVVCTNAGLAIQLFEPQKKLTDCIAIAEETLLSRKAYHNFKSLLS